MNPYANYLQSITSPSAHLAQLNALRPAREETRKPIQPKMRTQEEIVAQLEARYAEMEAELAKPERKWPCRSCRYWRDEIYQHCTHPLVKGVGRPQWCWDKHPHPVNGARTDLCGPEKALWEQRPTRWQRFIAWLGLDARV